MFDFETKLGKKEVNALNVFNTFSKNVFIQILFMVIFITLFGILYYEERDIILLVFALCFGLGFPLLCFITMKISVWFYIRSSKMIADNNLVFFNFNDDSINIRTEKPDMVTTTNIKWNLLYKAFETKKYYFMYISNMQSYIIPKETIKTGTIKDFSNLLTSKLSKKYRLKYFRLKGKGE